jgi:hypothetical protein
MSMFHVIQGSSKAGESLAAGWLRGRIRFGIVHILCRWLPGAVRTKGDFGDA